MPPPTLLPVCATAAAKAVQAARWALPPPMLARRDAVLDFWFGVDTGRADDGTGTGAAAAAAAAPRPAVVQNFDLWFGGSEATDKLIADTFRADVEAAARGEYRLWAHESPQSLLALIILLDQFPMNIYRDKPQGYEISEMAIPLAYTAIGRGWIDKVDPAMRMFFTLPLMHSEKIDDQVVSRLRGFDAEADEESEFNKEHHHAVHNHGRFPGRNVVMSRESDAEELEYLKNGGAF